MNSKLDLGVRYATPVLALAMPYLGLSAARLSALPRRIWLLGAVAALYAVPVLIQFPNLISFSSELVQPYGEGWRYMNDSNIDWGQQAEAVAAYARATYPRETIAADYFWNPYQLGYYGLKTTGFDPAVPPTDKVILLTADQLSNSDYSLFRQMKPIGNVANEAYFYRVKP